VLVTEPVGTPPPVENRPLSQATAPGWQIEYVDVTGSTNAVASAVPTPGRVVVTDHQTAGRGRLDRAWETPAGVALTFSAVLDPGQPDARWPWLPLLTGVAVATAVRDATGLDAGLKWPNDVLMGDRKLAGILVERVAGRSGPVAVVGVGLNVHQRVLPVPGATSLALEGAAVDRAVLLEEVLVRLTRCLRDWSADAGGPARLLSSYVLLCRTLGREVTVHLPGDRRLVGRAVDVDLQGRLVVEDGGGVRRPVGAGDVVHVRAAGPQTSEPVLD
jgi:BirA family biotin operon repressor/biotin-[acetyl-CoA-carboxylase] ligase